MAATLRYGRECALLGRSPLNFMRIPRDAHTADLTLGNVGDLLFTAIGLHSARLRAPEVPSELSRPARTFAAEEIMDGPPAPVKKFL
jgi:hypothetical protein